MNSFFYIKYDEQQKIIAQSSIEREQFGWDLHLLSFILYLTKHAISLGAYFKIQHTIPIDKKLSLTSGEQYALETLLQLHNRQPKFNLLRHIEHHFQIEDDRIIQNIINEIQKQPSTELKKKYYINALAKVSYEIISAFRPKTIFVKGHKLEAFSVLAHLGFVDYVINLSTTNKEFITSYKQQGQRYYINIGGLFDDRQYDYLIPYFIKNHNFELKYQTIFLQSPFLNIAGDTYFGEYYTAIRKKRKIDDALQQHGYSYSFERIAPFFKKNDFNIVNFEATLTTQDDSHLKLQKSFILYADPLPSLNTLKNFNFQCATLANNHAMDYGRTSLADMLVGFEKNEIHTVGAGLDQNQASQFLEVNYQQQKFAIFNGYWSKINVLNNYDYFALADQAGVNSINGILFEQIYQYKQKNPESIICCICHWGLDFKPVHPYQSHLAHKLIDFGTDIIIGHGAHTIQQIEIYKDKPIIYSIGNAVFNSNGEYAKHQALPYGFLVKLNIENFTLSLYPIFTNNLETFWQPNFVNAAQFNEIIQFLDIKPMTYIDELGFSLQFKLN